MKISIANINDAYVAPSGTLHLGTHGWIVDRPERLTVQTNLSLEEFANRVAGQNAGLLGDGELSLSVIGELSIAASNPFIKVFQCRIMFYPTPELYS